MFICFLPIYVQIKGSQFHPRITPLSRHKDWSPASTTWQLLNKAAELLMAGSMAGELVISSGMVGKGWKLNIHNISMVEMVGWWFPSLSMDKIHRIFRDLLGLVALKQPRACSWLTLHQWKWNLAVSVDFHPSLYKLEFLVERTCQLQGKNLEEKHGRIRSKSHDLTPSNRTT